MTLAKRVARLALFLGALLLAVVFARTVPASEGGYLPGGLLLLAVSARAVRRLTSPESRRA